MTKNICKQEFLRLFTYSELIDGGRPIALQALLKGTKGNWYLFSGPRQGSTTKACIFTCPYELDHFDAAPLAFSSRRHVALVNRIIERIVTSWVVPGVAFEAIYSFPSCNHKFRTGNECHSGLSLD